MIQGPAQQFVKSFDKQHSNDRIHCNSWQKSDQYPLTAQLEGGLIHNTPRNCSVLLEPWETKTPLQPLQNINIGYSANCCTDSLLNCAKAQQRNA